LVASSYSASKGSVCVVSEKLSGSILASPASWCPVYKLFDPALFSCGLLFAHSHGDSLLYIFLRHWSRLWVMGIIFLPKLASSPLIVFVLILSMEKVARWCKAPYFYSRHGQYPFFYSAVIHCRSPLQPFSNCC
jgi:hypothetical protein